MKKDELTYQVSRAFNTLFLYNVLGTSRGVVLGFFLLGLQNLIAKYFPSFGLIEWYCFIMFGVILFNIEPMVKKKYIDPNIEKQLLYIRLMIKEGEFTEAEKRTIWRNAINSIILEYNQNIDTTNNNADSHNPTPE